MVDRNLLRQYDLPADELQLEMDAAFNYGQADWLPAEAQTAITALNGAEVEGRTLTVNEARPKTEGGGGGGGRGGGGGYGGGGGGGRRY